MGACHTLLYRQPRWVSLPWVLWQQAARCLTMSEIASLLLVCREFAETHKTDPLCPLDLDLTWLETWPRPFGVHCLRRLRDLRWAGHEFSRDYWNQAVAGLRQQGPLVVSSPGRGELVIERAQFCQPWYELSWKIEDLPSHVLATPSPSFYFAGVEWRMSLRRGYCFVWIEVTALVSNNEFREFAMRLRSLDRDRQENVGSLSSRQRFTTSCSTYASPENMTENMNPEILII